MQLRSAAQTKLRSTAASAAEAVAVAPFNGYLLRGWFAAMFAATIWVTRKLWTEHAEPPLLPLVELPAFNYYGELLLLTAAAYVVWPRCGLAANFVVGVVAMIADQTRMQPQMFSFWLLMLGTLARPQAVWLARCHLASLWFFSGFHKLISDAYYTDVAPWMWGILFPPQSWPGLPDYSEALAAAVATSEIAMGLLIWFVPLRRAVAVGGIGLHSSVVLMLARANWNTSVWAWNLAIVVASAAYLWRWRDRLRDTPRAVGLTAFIAGLLLYVSPLLYYLGLLDAYLSYCLYSANVPTATMSPRSDPGQAPYNIHKPYWEHLNVPQPPTHRNFENYFRRVGKPGDVLIVVDDRAWAKPAGYRFYAWQFGVGGIERIPLPESGLPPK